MQKDMIHGAADMTCTMAQRKMRMLRVTGS